MWLSCKYKTKTQTNAKLILPRGLDWQQLCLIQITLKVNLEVPTCGFIQYLIYYKWNLILLGYNIRYYMGL